jgi:SAM-dependent methyltransferase
LTTVRPAQRSCDVAAGRARTARTHLTGERPRRVGTPASILSLHDAGYRAVLERLGPGRVLDVGCGEGFESVRFAGPGREVVAVDYSYEAAEAARRAVHDIAAAYGMCGRPAFSVAQTDAVALGLASGAFDAVCSSHLIEHFADPSGHVAEVARVLADTGTAFFLTPNAPADFENPFHLRLFEREDLARLLRRCFAEVWVGALDATARLKAQFAARRAKAEKLLRLDVFDFRHRMPRRWYVAAYTRLLPIAYALVARTDRGRGGPGRNGARGGQDVWSVSDEVDETTLVLFAICRRPRR